MSMNITRSNGVLFGWIKILSLSLIVCYPMMSEIGLAASLGAGGEHTCGITTDEQVVCWGSDAHGQSTPPAENTFIDISTGYSHTCGVKKTDATDNVVCWGDNTDGQATPPNGTFATVSAGDRHTCGVKDNGSVVCWGNDESNQSTPPEDSFVSVSAGTDHTCGLKTNGSIVCWGNNTDGQSTPPATPPADIFTEVSAGGWHTCGRKVDESVVCWGKDEFGQETPPNKTFTQISAGSDHTCGVTIDRKVACWGDNHFGQAPSLVTGSFAYVSAGFQHSCGIKTNASVECWGNETDTSLITPPKGLILTVESTSHGCEPATYYNDRREIEVPYIEVPLHTDINGQTWGAGLYSAVLAMPFGFTDIEVKELSFINTVTDSDVCHAQFTSDMGILTIPQINVPTIIPYLYGDPISGPVLDCNATLQQSILRPTIFKLKEFDCTLP